MPLEYFETDGGKLAVEIEGDGPLIICAPGLGDHRDVYTPLSQRLVSEGYKVARIDNRGHGDSSTTFNSYGDLATAEDFLFLASKLGGGKRVAIAGSSFAAGSATIAAAKNPDAFAGIILLGPFLRNANAFAPWITPVLFWRPWGPAVWKMYAKTLWPGLGAKAAERAAGSHAKITRPGYYAAFQKTVGGLDHSVVEPYHSKVGKTPALVVMGDKDVDFSKPREEAEWIASLFEDHKVQVLEGVGHAPMFERPEEVGGSVSEFVAKLKREGRF